MPRFVILEHDHPDRHWDFMLEAGEVLWTWRLPAPPGPTSEPMVATRIDDHRLAYLTYEGPISGGRGKVQRWDGGSFSWEEGRIPGPDRIVIDLRGEKTEGRAILEKMDPPLWHFYWKALPGLFPVELGA